jgi:hypothetical protein
MSEAVRDAYNNHFWERKKNNRREEREKMSIIVDNTFRLQRPMAANALQSALTNVLRLLL